eukprot:COSAG01_NODE_1500_length_10110_cov_4.433923_8_plen_140_part_00
MSRLLMPVGGSSSDVSSSSVLSASVVSTMKSCIPSSPSRLSDWLVAEVRRLAMVGFLVFLIARATVVADGRRWHAVKAMHSLSTVVFGDWIIYGDAVQTVHAVHVVPVPEKPAAHSHVRSFVAIASTVMTALALHTVSF